MTMDQIRMASEQKNKRTEMKFSAVTTNSWGADMHDYMRYVYGWREASAPIEALLDSNLAI